MNERLHWTVIGERLAEAGVRHFTGLDVVQLRNAKARKAVGAPKIVTLPAAYIDNVIAVALYLEIIRVFASRRSGQPHPIYVLGWYRPGAADSKRLRMTGSYNRAAGGKSKAHELGGSVDTISGLRIAADLRAAHVDAWRACEDATGFGRYKYGREHVEVAHEHGKLARHWHTVGAALTDEEVEARYRTQSSTIGSVTWWRDNGGSRGVVERLAEKLADLEAGEP